MLRWDRLTILLVLGILLLSALFEYSEPINRDVAGFIYLSREYLFHDKIPYQDIIDFNPPFSTWIFMPMVAAGSYLRLSSEATIQACLAQLYILVVLGLLVSWFVLKMGDLPLSKRHRHVFIVLFSLVAIIGCATAFGQREQLILVFILPQMLLSCAAALKRTKASKIGSLLRIASGAFAFAGIAMKPHYIVALLLPESLAWLRRRSLKASFRPETLTILLLGIVYTCVIVFGYPAIFDVSGKLAIQYYHEFSILSPQGELLNVALLAALFLLRIVFRFFGKPAPYDPLLAGVFGAYLSYLAQEMGSFYQKIPFEGLAVAWILLALPPLWPFRKAPKAENPCVSVIKKHNIRYSIVSIGVWGLASFVSIMILQTSILRAGLAGLSLFGVESTIISEVSKNTRALLHRYAGREPVTFLGTSMEAFPAVVYEDLELANRWGFLWPLPGELNLPSEQRGMLARSLADDIRKDKPGLVLVNMQNIQLLVPYNFDYVAYFSQWAEFREEWKNYEKITPQPGDDFGAYALFRRVKR